MNLERVLRSIKRGKLCEMISDPVAISYPTALEGVRIDGYQMSIYDPNFSPYCYYLGDGKILIANNTYLTSFVAECVSIWMSDIDYETFTKLLRYNLKKFYAEQILAKADIMIGRALFLETLLFEEPLMVEFSEKRKASTELTETYEAALSIVDGILIQHELAHVAQRLYSGFSVDLAKDLNCPDISSEWERYSKEVSEEFEADGFATLLSWKIPVEGTESSDKLTLLCLCHAFLACMNSLYFSAMETVKDYPESKDTNMLGDFYGQMTGSNPTIGVNPFFRERGLSAINLSLALAAQDEVEALISRAAPLQDCLTTIHTIGEDILGGDTARYRAKCELLAHAFHSHKQGMKFLTWRSKQFSFPKGRLDSE